MHDTTYRCDEKVDDEVAPEEHHDEPEQAEDGRTIALHLHVNADAVDCTKKRSTSIKDSKAPPTPHTKHSLQVYMTFAQFSVWERARRHMRLMTRVGEPAALPWPSRAA